MSRSRQPAGPQVRTMAVVYAAGYTWRGRVSEWAQLLYASRGMMTVHTDAGSWVVPPHQALWVPPRVRHHVEMAGRVAMRAVYLNDTLTRRLSLGSTCGIVDISPLLRELLRRTMALRTLDRHKVPERHLMDVLLDQLAVLPQTPVDLPMPRDARGARAATLVRESPAARHTLADIARTAGASARTLERLFRAETGFSFGAWRQRARILRALQLLAGGATVTGAAIAVGYESPSAFVYAFRRALGTTPGQYFRNAARA